MTGLIADIKRFSVHDGPGIRTTVFMKGCPLECLWCHNPENLSAAPVVAHTPALCAGCVACAAACPVGAIRVGDGHRIDRTICAGCGACAAACMPGALKLYGTSMTPGELADAALEDADFYAASGGGVTLSGGEPLLHADFCAEALELLRLRGVHTAVDTCGDVPAHAFEAVVPATDLFLYDIKLIDGHEHAHWTGRPNARILENLRMLDGLGARVEVRVPIIPGVNADGASLDAIAGFLASLEGGHTVRLLPYHHMSAGKYAAVGMVYGMPETVPPTADEMEAFRARMGALYGGRVVLPGERA